MTNTNTEIPVAVVTGGSRGIGRAVVLRLAGEGRKVHFCHFDPTPEAAEETETLATAAGGWARGSRVDVTDKAAVAGFFKAVIEESGRLDILVNNAGVTKDGFLVRMKEADWDRVVDTNLKGMFFCLQEAARTMMRQRAGRVVNIASVVGHAGNPGQANYAAAKAGVLGMTRVAARELASRNITVNAVSPGFIETEMTASLPEKAREAIIAQTPLGRMGTPEEVAHVVSFLCSEGAAFITGQAVQINGGLYM